MRVSPEEITKNSSTRKDEALVREIQNGAESGIRQLYDRFSPRIISFVIGKFGLSSEEAEELYNDVVLEVCKRIASYGPDKGASFTTWIFIIAKRRTIDFIKSKRKRNTANEIQKEDEWWGNIADVDALYQRQDDTSPDQEALLKVQKTLGTLSPDRQEILRMSARGMEPKEIAEKMGKTANAVSAALHHAKKQFAETYERLKQQSKASPVSPQGNAYGKS